MDESAIAVENEKLKASWDCISAEQLATYLRVDEQDQRINAQSILTRALLVDALWPGRFDAIITEEMRFGVVMTWLVERLKAGTNRFFLLDEVLRSAAGEEVPEIPDVVRKTAEWLQTDGCPIGDYVSDALMFTNPDRPQSLLAEPALDTLIGLWKKQLAGLTAERINVLEAACGSGNDYSTIRAAGIDGFLSYSGFDLSSKCVSNARAEFPGVAFFEASLLNSGLPDGCSDYVFVHDLFGHFSADAMEEAAAEIMRLARREVWIHCHNAVDIEQHQIRPYRRYFRNRISVRQFSASLSKGGASVQAVPISGMLQRKFGFAQGYSSTSVTFIATKDA